MRRLFLRLRRLFLRLRSGPEQHEVGHLVGELVVLHRADLDEWGQRFPDFGVALRFIAVQLLEPIRHLLGHEAADRAHAPVGLQGRAAHVQRDVGRIDHAAQGQQVAGHHLLDRITHEHVVAVELDLPLLPVSPARELGEVEDALQVVGVVGVEVHPEQRVALEGVEVAVELDVVVVAEIARALAPGRLALVHRFALQLHRHRQEVAVGGDQGADAGRLDVLELLLHQVQDHIGAGFTALGGSQAEVGGAVAAPAHRLAALAGGAGHQLHLPGHHETGVEAQAEVADDRVVLALVLLQEILGTGKGHLVDVALHLIGVHADAVVRDGQRLGLAVDADVDQPLRALAAVASHRRHAPLADGIHAIAHQFPQEHLMAAVDGLLDDREDVLGVDLDLTLFGLQHHRFARNGCLRLPRVGPLRQGGAVGRKPTPAPAAGQLPTIPAIRPAPCP